MSADMSFPVAIGEVERDLPFRQVAPLVTAPVLNLLGDVEAVAAATQILAPHPGSAPIPRRGRTGPRRGPRSVKYA